MIFRCFEPRLETYANYRETAPFSTCFFKLVNPRRGRENLRD